MLLEESFEESELQRKRKVKAMISHMVNRSTVAERIEVVENIPIEWTERLGWYNEQRSRQNLQTNKIAAYYYNARNTFQMEYLLTENTVLKQKKNDSI